MSGDPISLDFNDQHYGLGTPKVREILEKAFAWKPFAPPAGPEARARATASFQEYLGELRRRCPEFMPPYPAAVEVDWEEVDMAEFERFYRARPRNAQGDSDDEFAWKESPEHIALSRPVYDARKALKKIWREPVWMAECPFQGLAFDVQGSQDGGYRLARTAAAGRGVFHREFPTPSSVSWWSGWIRKDLDNALRWAVIFPDEESFGPNSLVPLLDVYFAGFYPYARGRDRFTMFSFRERVA